MLKPGGCVVLSDVLLTSGAEQHRASFKENSLEDIILTNSLQDINDYSALFKQLGFSEIKVIDATEECWRRYFMNIVHFIHEKFLAKEIDQACMEDFLQRSYRLASNLENYLLVAVQK